MNTQTTKQTSNIIHSVYYKHSEAGNHYNPLCLCFSSTSICGASQTYLISISFAVVEYNISHSIWVSSWIYKVLLAMMVAIEQAERNGGVSSQSFASWINWLDKRGAERCFAWVYKSRAEPKRQRNLLRWLTPHALWATVQACVSAFCTHNEKRWASGPYASSWEPGCRSSNLRGD